MAETGSKLTPSVLQEAKPAVFGTPKSGRWSTPSWRNLPRLERSSSILLIFFGIVFAALFFWLIFLFVFWEVIATAISVVVKDKKKGERQEPWFLPEPSKTGEEMLVDLTICVDGRECGRDRGVMAIDGDLLFFAGAGCSFALGPQDIDVQESSEKYRPSKRRGAFMIRIRHPELKLEVAVLPGDAGSDLPGAFTRIVNWVDLTAPSDRPRSFPPTERPKISRVGLRRRPELSQ